MADGSLKFDTKIDTGDFNKGISTLKKALDRLTEAVESLSSRMMNGFNGAGAAAANAEKDVGSIGDSAKKAEEEVKSLQEQMDAITVKHLEDADTSNTSKEVSRSVPVNKKDLEYDPQAMAAVFGDAASEIHSWSDAIGQYGTRPVWP